MIKKNSFLAIILSLIFKTSPFSMEQIDTAFSFKREFVLQTKNLVVFTPNSQDIRDRKIAFAPCPLQNSPLVNNFGLGIRTPGKNLNQAFMIGQILIAACPLLIKEGKKLGDALEITLDVSDPYQGKGYICEILSPFTKYVRGFLGKEVPFVNWDGCLTSFHPRLMWAQVSLPNIRSLRCFLRAKRVRIISLSLKFGDCSPNTGPQNSKIYEIVSNLHGGRTKKPTEP